VEVDEHDSGRGMGDSRRPYATEPIYEPPSLLAARVIRQRDAQALRSIIERCLNEAHVHGAKGVRMLLQIDHDRLVVRIGNRPGGETCGISGEGGRELNRLARRPPDGSIDRGLKPASAVRMPPGPEWWVAELRGAASVLDRTMEYFAPG
jgi:hypothetical protein